MTGASRLEPVKLKRSSRRAGERAWATMARAGPLLMAIGAFGVGLGGCAGRAPELTVRGAYVVEQGPEGTLINVVVDAWNPLPRTGTGVENDKPLREARYRVTALGGAGAGVGRAVRLVQATAAPMSTRRFELPITIPGAQRPERVEVSGLFQYEPTSKLRQLLADWLPLPTTRVRAEVAVSPSGEVLSPPAPYRVVTSVGVNPDGSTTVIPQVR